MTSMRHCTSVRAATTVCWIALMPFVVALGAQETTGTIFGTFLDQAGGVLPGVRVVAVSADTGLTREVVTNGVGQFTVALPVGDYEVTFRLPDSRVFTIRRVSVHVNDRLPLDASMQVGAVETLDVKSERLLQPTAAVQTLIPPVALRELPHSSRTLIQRVTLVPGVSGDLREDACFCDQGNLNIAFNGARRSANNWLVDGANIVDSWDSYKLVTTPSLEAIQEMNVITSTYSAEWGRNGGGIVNAVTKSGSNRFSGGAYEFLRNDVLNANSFFRNMNPNSAVNSSPPRLRYNNFGYTVGGPALPDRKRAFFFISEEWRQSTRDKRPLEALVPDPAWLIDPASPQYVPPEARDPNAVRMLSVWPAPNVPGRNRYRTIITNELDTRQEFVRADYNVSAKWSLTGHYLRDQIDSVGEYSVFPDIAPGRRDRLGHLAVVQARRAAGRSLYEMSYQVSSQQQVQRGAQHTRGNLGILIPEIYPENAADLVPRLSIAGVASFEGSEASWRRQLHHAVSSVLTFQHDAHTFKGGGLIALERANANLFDEKTHGWFVFSAGGGFTGFQNFLRGNAQSACGAACNYRETATDVLSRLRSGRYELFVQDTWRIHPRITLDLGLRYAFYPPVTDENDMLFGFSPQDFDPARAPAFADSSGDSLAVGTGDLFNGIRVAGRNSPHGRALYGADTNNLQPRVGVSWDPGGTGDLLVRAGFGVYFDQTRFERFAYATQEPALNPFREDVFVSNARLADPAKGSVVQPTTVFPSYALGVSDPFLAPRWQHWNVGVQRRVFSRGVVDVGYVGGRGDQLPRNVNVNQPQPADLVGRGNQVNTVRPFPGYTEIFMQETTAKSRYHGLLASFRHEIGRSGLASVNYTLSRNKTDATYDFSWIDDPQNPLDKEAEFAEAATDRLHIFNASYVYELPFARDGAGRWRKALLGGWQIAGVTWIESGPPARIDVTNFSYDGQFFPSYLRPNQVGNPGVGEQTGLFWFDPAAYVPSPEGEYGTAPVVVFRLPGRYQWDFALSKTVHVGGTKRLQFKADLINAFNHTQFLDVSTSCFGSTTCDTEFSTFGQAYSTRPPREIQLGVRFDW